MTPLLKVDWDSDDLVLSDKNAWIHMWTPRSKVDSLHQTGRVYWIAKELMTRPGPCVLHVGHHSTVKDSLIYRKVGRAQYLFEGQK